MVTRRPVLQRYTFHTTVTVAILQNARRTPGDSARLARVELSEKAITRPTTASAPSAFAPGVSGRVGEIAIVMELDGTRGASTCRRQRGGHRTITSRDDARGRRRPRRSTRRSGCPGSPLDDRGRRRRRARRPPPDAPERSLPPDDRVLSPPLSPPGRAAPADLPAGPRS